MRTLWTCAAAMLLTTSVLAQETADPEDPTADKQKLSYAIGMDIAQKFKSQGVELDPDSLAQGMKDALAGTPKITREELQKIFVAFSTKMRQRAQQQSDQDAQKNLEAANSFLEENKQKDDVTTLPSGLQYTVVSTGTGPKPGPNDMVVVHYRGTLLSGEEFDSSYSRGQPARFQVSGVIKGWTEALQLMNAGSKWKLFIPPDLGYGARGAGRDIGPNEALVFDVELIEVVGK